LKFDRIVKQVCLKKKIITYVKNERSNLNGMINALKFVVVKVIVWRKVFKVVVLVMFFQGMPNMARQMRKYARISNMFLLNLHKKICKSALQGPFFLERASNSGKRLVLKLVYA
jgi:small-conductance mechanosensitive channel